MPPVAHRLLGDVDATFDQQVLDPARLPVPLPVETEFILQPGVLVKSERVIVVTLEDGTIHIIYDHQRYTLNRAGKRGVGSVVMATFREEDVRAARTVTDQARLRVVITQLQKAMEVSQGELK